MRVHALTDSPIGPLLLTGDGRRLTGCWLHPEQRPAWQPERGERDDDAFDDARRQLAEYFAGQRRVFDLDLAPMGTPFQLAVWAELSRIPYGETASYGELATRIGRPRAARAVGLANGRNPLSIIVPCHRVVGADGTLTGYAGGLERKRYLLDLERRQAPLPAAV